MDSFYRSNSRIALLSVLLATCSPALACDPHENCNRCLASAFGHCITHGNDPACEARKAVCQVPVAGPILTAPLTPLGPGGILGPGGPGVGPVTGEDIKFCYSHPNGCSARVVSSLVYSQLAPIVDQYIQYLENQGNGRWQSIPNDISSKIGQHYPDVALGAVRLAMGVNTVHGQTITIGNDIFVPYALDFNNRDDLQLLFHELEHVGQYGRRGGVRQFLAEYISKIPGKVISNRSFLIHDDIDIERAAIAKSEEVIIDYYGWNFYILNECSHPLSFAFNYLMTDGTWKTTGYWSAKQNEGFRLVSEDNLDLHSKNKLFYIYAEATDDSGVKWNGDSGNSDDRAKTVPEDNRQLLFKKYVVVDSNPDKLRVSFSCPGK